MSSQGAKCIFPIAAVANPASAAAEDQTGVAGESQWLFPMMPVVEAYMPDIIEARIGTQSGAVV